MTLSCCFPKFHRFAHEFESTSFFCLSPMTLFQQSPKKEHTPRNTRFQADTNEVRPKTKWRASGFDLPQQFLGYHLTQKFPSKSVGGRPIITSGKTGSPPFLLLLSEFKHSETSEPERSFEFSYIKIPSCLKQSCCFFLVAGSIKVQSVFRGVENWVRLLGG